jgi:RNA polymerase sigma-70 factor (ECF subfamily)
MTEHNNVVTFRELADFFNARHQQLQNYLFWQVRSQEVAEELAQETYLRFLKQSGPQHILNLNAFLGILHRTPKVVDTFSCQKN